jgi:hypothetical protein
MQAAKGTKKVLQSGPDALDCIVVDLIDAVAINVTGKFLITMLDRQMLTLGVIDDLVRSMAIGI